MNPPENSIWAHPGPADVLAAEADYARQQARGATQRAEAQRAHQRTLLLEEEAAAAMRC